MKRLSLLALLPLAILLAACGPAHRHYQAGPYSLTSDRLSGDWSRLYATLPERVTCLKWESDSAGDVSCLSGHLFDDEKPRVVSSVHADQSGWSVAEIGAAGAAVLCVKWEGDFGAGLSCRKRQGAYDDAPATVRSEQAAGGWSEAEVKVPGQPALHCVKWQDDEGKQHGGAAVSCRPETGSFPLHPQVLSTSLGHGWSIAELSYDNGPGDLCLKWQGSDAGGMSCQPLERHYSGGAVISDVYFGGSWYRHDVRIPGYTPLRCLQWDTDGSGGMSCWPRPSAS